MEGARPALECKALALPMAAWCRFVNQPCLCVLRVLCCLQEVVARDANLAQLQAELAQVGAGERCAGGAE